MTLPLTKASLVVLLTLTTITLSHAGVITQGVVTTDASTGISTSNTYTAAINFNDDTSQAASVNGVAFTNAGGGSSSAGNYDHVTGITTGQGFNANIPSDLTISSTGDIWSHSNTGTGTGLAGIEDGFIFQANGGGFISTETFTLSGLTVGTTYDLTLYLTVPSGNSDTITFNENGVGGTTTSATLATIPTSGLSTVSYAYKAGANNIVATISNDAGGTFFYALTNQVVVPEPSTWAMLLAGLGALTFWGFRSRRA